MPYLLMIVSDENGWTSLPADQQQHVMEQHEALERDLRTQNKFLYCGGLGPSAQGKTLRRNGAGEVLVTDGPFLETKEVLGGYYVIDAASIDEAVEWAKRIPTAVKATIEVREITH